MRNTMFRQRKALHSNIRTLSHLWNMLVVVSWLAIIDETINSELYPQILNENIRIFVQNWILRENGSLYYYKLFNKRMVKEEQS